jgi:hypothetical protein
MSYRQRLFVTRAVSLRPQHKYVRSVCDRQCACLGVMLRDRVPVVKRVVPARVSQPIQTSQTAACAAPCARLRMQHQRVRLRPVEWVCAIPISRTAIVWQQTAVKCSRAVISPTVDVVAIRVLFHPMRRRCVVAECVVWGRVQVVSRTATGCRVMVAK